MFLGQIVKLVTPEGQFLGRVPVISLRSRVAWQGTMRDHDCDACVAWANAELFVTAAAIGLAPNGMEGEAHVLVPAPPLSTALNRLAPGQPTEPQPSAWRHDERCAARDEGLADFLGRVEKRVDAVRGHCHMHRMQNCDVERLLDRVRELEAKLAQVRDDRPEA